MGLYRTLGKRGRLRVGAISRSNPYRDYDGGVALVTPAISYHVAVEFFEGEITDSPLVDEDYVVKGFLAPN